MLLSAVKPQSKFPFVVQQFCKKFASVAVNVKPQNATSAMFLDQISQEWHAAKPFTALPGPTKYQLWRGFLKGGDFYKLSMNDLLLTCRKRYGDIFFMPGLFGQHANVMLFNVEDFERVHRTEGAYPIRPGQEVMLHYRSKRADNFFKNWQGLAGNGEQWWKFRHAVNPVLMQPRNARLYLEPIQKVNEDFIQRIRETRDSHTLEVPQDFKDDIYYLAFESLAAISVDMEIGLLRRNSDNQAAMLLFQSMNVFLESFYDLGIKPSIYKYIRTPTYRRFEKAMDTIFDITSMYVNKALQRVESRQGGSDEGLSVVEKLFKINREIAIIMAMDMLMGGTDTTAAVLSGLLLNIAKNPDKQALLRAEILEILPNKSQKFTVDNMKNLPYLRACIKESLRIYPIVAGNIRETGRDLVLSGYRVPQGTRAFMCSNLLLKDERFYTRAKEFLPERWLRNSADGAKLLDEKLNPFIYLPFGFGPRSCVGKRVVDLQLELTLAELVRNFQIEFNYSTENAFKNYFISRPAIPLKFKFIDLNY